MVRPTNKASDTARELRACSASDAMRNASRQTSWTDRALQVLEDVARAIAARRPPVPLILIKPNHK